MKAIIDGKRYDTETAEELARLPSTEDRGSFDYHETKLYRTKRGRYFLAGHGNARSRWATPLQNGSTGGSGIQALDEDEARAYLESCGEDGVQALEKYFSIEDA